MITCANIYEDGNIQLPVSSPPHGRKHVKNLATVTVLRIEQSVCLQGDNGHAPYGSHEAALQPLEDPPSLIADAPGLQIWHKLDRTFKRPIAVAYLCITPRFAYDSAKTAALMHLVLKLLQDDIIETAYLADVAGLQFDVSSSSLLDTLWLEQPQPS